MTLAFSFGLSHQGFHDKVLEDCDAVLSVNASNCKALYRKSKALSDLGRYREAYDAVAKCSLAVPQVCRGLSSSLLALNILLLLYGEMACERIRISCSCQPALVQCDTQ